MAHRSKADILRDIIRNTRANVQPVQNNPDSLQVSVAKELKRQVTACFSNTPGTVQCLAVYHSHSNIYFSVHFDDLNGNLSFTDYKIEMEEVSGAINPDDLKEVGHDEWVANVAGLKNLLK